MALIEGLGKKLESYYADLRSTIDALKSKNIKTMQAATLRGLSSTRPRRWLASGPQLLTYTMVRSPNLYETIAPSGRARSKTFYVGSREFDPIKVGFKTDQAGRHLVIG